ncbi:MAG: hypothetical protein ABFS35_08190 [Bacteroidota bacterium]
MKNKLIILISILLLSIPSFAQNDLGTIDDYGRITLTPVVPKNVTDMPHQAVKLLQSRLQQVASKNGLGGVAIQPQFIITATVDVVSKDITSTAPPMVAMNMEITMYIIDYVNKTTFSSVTISAKGVGKSDTKAYIQGIKRINPKSSKVRSFVKKGKNKIIEYYNTQCDVIIKEAQTLEKQDKYEEAIHKLITVPEVCQECYFKAMDAIEPIYNKMIGETCKEDITAAKTALENNNIEDAKKYLNKILPGTDCYDDAVDLAKQVNSKQASVNEEEGIEQTSTEEFVLQSTAPATREEKVSAYKQVGHEYNQSQTQEEYDLDFVEN